LHEKSALLNERQGLTELRVICAVAGEWESLLASQLVCSPFVENSHERSEFLTLRFEIVETGLCIAIYCS
jgi:hypothetical protein